ncbi:MAG: hypothetical protein U9R16_04225 [Campylobacterota bacterium]|nr:hypothetical protein [Campylobacterota bacterium]
MEYIYIKNYLKIPQQQKIKFLNFINRCEDFKVTNQNIIFSEESLILDLSKDSDIKKAYSYSKKFFKDIKGIKVNIIKKTFDQLNQMTLTFNDTNKQIRI